MNMKRTILKGPGFCAVTEDGILVEYVPVNAGEQSGAILLGKTDRLMPGMNCAFVDIGRKKSGFLPLDENSGSFTGDGITLTFSGNPDGTTKPGTGKTL